jgi:hypothetical protein
MMARADRDRVGALIAAHQDALATYRSHKNCVCKKCRIARYILRLYDKMRG